MPARAGPDDVVMSGLGLPELRAVVRLAQEWGMLGRGDPQRLIEHSRAFVDALPPADKHSITIVDLGCGGGLPGFVVAFFRPDAHVTMVDRRAKRTDFCERMVRRMGWVDRVRVLTADVGDLPTLLLGTQFDHAVSRGFGPPLHTAALAAPLIRAGGSLVVSEPPEPDPRRWSAAELAPIGFAPPETVGGVAVLRRQGL